MSMSTNTNMRPTYKLNKKAFYKIMDIENGSLKNVIEKTGVSVKTMYKLYNYFNPVISESVARQIANTYGMKVYELLGDEVK